MITTIGLGRIIVAIAIFVAGWFARGWLKP